MVGMECQICSRYHSEAPALQCPACARAALFPLRLQQVQTLVEKERVGKQVEAVLTSGTSNTRRDAGILGDENDLARCATTAKHSRLLGELAETRERIDTITRHAATLKENMDSLKRELDEQNATTLKRRNILGRSREELVARKRDRTSRLHEDCKEHSRRYDAQYKDIIAMRIKRCKKAITLAGLKQVVKPIDGNKKVPQYCLWSMLLPDIKHINSAEPTHVSTMLYHVSRLVCQLSSYLHVRLPAEITLPHADWPMPTIFSPASSYSGRSINFPGTSPSSSRDNSAKSSRELEQRTAGRPRHLFVDRKLPKLARENPAAYALFVEGIALLAWDVAWLCRVQGLPVAERDWDDVCDMGRNLWLLFANTRGTPSTRRRTSSKDPIVTVKHADGVKAFSSMLAPAALGVHSHRSAKHFLERAASADSGLCDVSAKGWAFAFPVKIIDELKAALLNDMSGHDWELLDEREDDVADGTDAEGDVVVDQTGQGAREGKEGKEGKEERKGTSGWTKLKSRGAEML